MDSVAEPHPQLEKAGAGPKYGRWFSVLTVDLPRWALATGLGGLMVGGVEAASYARDITTGLQSLLLGGLIVSVVWLPLGALLALLTRAVAFVASRFGISEWFRHHLRPAPEPPRAPVVVLHAAALAAFLATGLALTVLGFLLMRLRAITETPELLVSGLGGTLIIVVTAWGIGVLLSKLLQPAAARLDALFGLPKPRAGWAAYLVWVYVPGMLVSLALALGTETPSVSLAGVLLALLLTSGAVSFRVRGIVAIRVGYRWTMLGVWVLAFASVAWKFDPDAVPAVRAPTLIQLTTDTLRSLSDVDGDGYSSLLGGGDCAAFAAEISPSASDKAGNGVDENCDGVDAVTTGITQQRPRPLLSGKLNRGQVRHYNVVWLMVDTMRADRMHTFGHKRKNTPNLDRLAKRSLVFEDAYSQSAGTPTSIASMLTGMTPGSIHWQRGAGGTRRPQLSPKNVSIAEVFRDAGYRTAGFLSSGMLKLIPETMQGFDDLRSLSGKAGSTSKVIDMLQADAKFGRDKKTRPFFVFGYYHGPHSPYRGTKRYGKRPIDRYDGAIQRTDSELAELISHLEAHPNIWKNTILIINSDHGEEFGEHGGQFHNNTCHVESTHVPIIMRVPGLKGRRVSGHVANVDIFPTLLELTGIQWPSSEMLDGQSLLVPALSKRRSTERAVLCFELNRKGDGQMHGTVRQGRWYLDIGLQRPHKQLFDTAADPREQANVYSSNPAEAQQLEQLIRANHTGNLTRGKWAKP